VTVTALATGTSRAALPRIRLEAEPTEVRRARAPPRERLADLENEPMGIPLMTLGERMKQRLKDWSSNPSMSGGRKSLASRHASMLLAAAVMSVGTFAACGGDDNNNNNTGTDAGSTPDGTSTHDAGNPPPDAGNPPPDAGNPLPDSGNPQPDAGGGDGGQDPNSAAAVLATINANIPGGAAKLQVPATNAAIPLPPAPASDPHRYDTTDIKAYLGKLLFHDPIRTQRVDKNQGQPKDLPASTAFGGTVGVSDSGGAPPPSSVFGSATTAQVQAVYDGTVATGSCGSCHLGEANGKAGQLLNFNTGGEGRGYVDSSGSFVPRRRPLAGLIKFRPFPLFPGDVGADALPTLTDIWVANGATHIATPAFFYAFPETGQPFPADLALLATGRLDQLDSVGRQAPSTLGFAFNNRMLFGGFGGQPHDQPGALQPSYLLNNGITNTGGIDDPAQENINFLLLDAHRMLNDQAAALRKIPAYQTLFKLAFPKEYAAAQAQDGGDPLAYIDDFTESRARSAFLRTDVTRNTPFDQFLAGNATALTPAQLRGAKLFFSKASDGGANCFSCHSGPMLNKQVMDTDLAGVGALVAENFVNVGIGDHPVQALNALARGHGTAYHAEDTGRAEITGNAADSFKFRSLTLRQLKDDFTFFHNGSFTDVRSVVEYFNKGIPQDPTAGAAPSLDPRFTSPRGAGTTGLGLSEAQVDDLTDFLVNGLFDPSHAKAFQPDPATDLAYSKPGTIANQYLAGVSGLIDGLMPSTLAIDDNDDLTRRDEGLQFLDVTPNMSTVSSTNGNVDTWILTNKGVTPIDTHLLVLVEGLAQGVTVDATYKTTGVVPPGADGVVTAPVGHPKGSAVAPNEPYYRVYVPSGLLNPGQSVSVRVTRTGGASAYSLRILSGQDHPELNLGRTP
jgi:cytochrome c peroxidase